MNEIVLGFDTRITDSMVISRLWADDRRRDYLINPNIEFPASVDSHAMPSVFLFSDEGGKTEIWELLITPDDWHQSAFWLWRNLEMMQEAVRRYSHKLSSYRLMKIAVTAFDKDIIEAGEKWDYVLKEPVDPAVLDNRNWRLLGYDIADHFFISGISNCGYNEKEKVLFQPRWSNEINKFGLLDEWDAAQEFRNWTNDRVPEHAPFAVYGIYEQAH